MRHKSFSHNLLKIYKMSLSTAPVTCHDIKQVSLLINGQVPTKFRYLGVSPGAKPESKPDRIYLIIPGNPGVAGYYDDFMVHLFNNLMSDVKTSDQTPTIWAVSHAGHEVVEEHELKYSPDKNRNVHGSDHMYTLPDQVRHKIDLISELVPLTSHLTLLGHSVGCLMAMEAQAHFAGKRRMMMSNLMLMPMLQRMGQTPNGRYTKFQTIFMYHLTIAFVWMIGSILGSEKRRNLIRWQMNLGRGKGDRVPECCVEATLSLLDWRSVRAALFMGHSELHTVKELDYKKFNSVSKYTRMYLGTSDGWCPREYIEEMQHKCDDIKCVRWSDAPHAFVLHEKDNFEVADLCAKWIKEDMISDEMKQN